MPTTLGFKPVFDLPEWRPISPSLAASAVGHCVTNDLRNSSWRDPHIWALQALTYLNKYNPRTDGWISTPSFTTLGGSVGAGSFAIFCPSHGPAGAVAGTPTTTSFTLATLPNSASINVNQLADNGNGQGFRIRVYGNSAGSSGKCEERTITANTAGTAPVITVDSAFSFTPAVGDHYEIMAGRIYMLTTGTVAAGFWKAYDIATDTCSGNLATTNLIATTATDSSAVMLDEQYVPYDRTPGDGLLSGGASYNGGSNQAIQGTAADATHITGSGMPAALAASEYANFQVRIVEDTVTPTAVGQRRRISSHTSGATGVFTVPAWTVTPSASAKFVVENNNDLLLTAGTTTVVYSYAAGGYAADANWSTAAAAGGAMQYANPPAAAGAGGLWAPCYGCEVDSARNLRHSHLIWFRGAASTAVYRLDIANGASGTWSAALTTPITTTLTTGASGVYDPVTMQGKYFYVNVNGTTRNWRFNVRELAMEPFADVRYSPGTAVVGGRCSMLYLIDGATKLGFLVVFGQVSSFLFEAPIVA